ncbi:MAG: nucleotidyl transferase AbiEii/AbiGii toxin family protein [Pseudomonadota bacterium]
MVRQGASQAVKPVFEAAREVQEFLHESGSEFCFIGGIALQRWGQPRFTRDVDLTLLCPLGSESGVIDRLLGRFSARRPDPKAFALKNRIVVVQTAAGIPIDIALGATGFEKACVRRATDFDFGSELSLRTCSAEDLVVLKSFAGRGQDWVDVEYVIVRQRKKLDWARVERDLKALLELSGAVENLETLGKLKAKVEKDA